MRAKRQPKVRMTVSVTPKDSVVTGPPMSSDSDRTTIKSRMPLYIVCQSTMHASLTRVPYLKRRTIGDA